MRTDNFTIPMATSSTLSPYLYAAEQMVGTKSVEIALENENINKTIFTGPPVFIPYKIEASIAESLARSIGMENFGAFLFRNVSYKELGIYADYVLGGHNLEDALKRGIKNLSAIVQGAQIQCVENSGRVWLGFDSKIEDTLGSKHIEQGVQATIINLVRLYAGPEWAPDIISVRESDKRNLSQLEDLFQTRVQSTEGMPGIKFCASLLRNPIMDAQLKNEYLTREDLFRHYPDEICSCKQLVCNHILLEIINGEVSLDLVAQRLGVGSRTLQRRLISESETFQSCLDQVRANYAKRLLLQTALSVNMIAKYLGFEEPNSFRRAFRKWHGLSAKEFRRTSQLADSKNKRKILKISI